jgi:hypothetical protein
LEDVGGIKVLFLQYSLQLDGCLGGVFIFLVS